MSGECVYLGTCDVENIFDESSGWEVDRIGGRPAWLSKELQVRCLECGGEVLFVGQLSCPLEEQYHRVLYIFVCPLPACILKSTNWSVVRCQRKAEQVPQVEAKVEVKCVFDDFSFDNLDWGSGENNSAKVDVDGDKPLCKNVCEMEQESIEVVEKLSELSVDADKETEREHPARVENDLKGYFSKADFMPYYINVSREEGQKEDLTHEHEILQRYLKDQNISLSDIENSAKLPCKESGQASTEPYEKRHFSFISQCQKKFFKRARKCPQQVIRYAYNDQPLLYNAAILPSDIKACPCGAVRVFELQVMPSLREFLVPTDSSNNFLEASEASCIYVFTCSRSCCAEAIHEVVVVQRDSETRDSA